MHIKVVQKDLEDAATAVSQLVERSPGPLPVIANILVEAEDGKVTFRGTDIESLVVVNLDATIERPGKTTIPADMFKDIVKLLPPMAEVSVEEKNGKVNIDADTNHYNLMSLPPGDFPDWQSEPGSTKFQISQKQLKEMIDATTYALPTKDHRRVLMGVHFELSDNNLRMTATDGKKLSRIHSSIPEIEGEGSCSIAVPKKILENLSRVLGSEGPVEIEMSSRQILFRLENMVYRCNGLEGKYPDCDAVIPKEFPTVIALNRDIFVQGARRAGLVTDEQKKSIILKFENNCCYFDSMAHDIGTFNSKVTLDYTGPTMEMGFNHQFLIETLSRFNNQEIKMYVKSPASPIVFKSDDQPNRLSLLMPIKLSDIRPMGVGAQSEAE